MAINANDIKWATNDVNDPITGLPNKVQPTAEFQNDGLKMNEPLARAHLNYMLDKNHEQHADLQAQIDALAVSAGQALLEQIYHVGAYYMSNSSQSPATRFNFGTWERVRGKFIVGVDENDTAFNAAGKVGGSKTHSHGNNLATSSAGEHAHTVDRDGWGLTQDADGQYPVGNPNPNVLGRLVVGSNKDDKGEDNQELGQAANDGSTSSTGSHTHSITGGIDSASNIPPYTSAYIWVRTA